MGYPGIIQYDNYTKIIDYHYSNCKLSAPALHLFQAVADITCVQSAPS